MFPFRNRFWWHVRNRQHHLMEVTRDHLHHYPGPYREVLEARAASMGRWLNVRAVLFGLVYFGIIAATLALILDRLPRFDLVEDVFDTINTVVQSLTTLFALALLLVMRYLGQLEADLVGCLAVGDLEARAEKGE